MCAHSGDICHKAVRFYFHVVSFDNYFLWLSLLATQWKPTVHTSPQRQLQSRSNLLKFLQMSQGFRLNQHSKPLLGAEDWERGMGRR